MMQKLDTPIVSLLSHSLIALRPENTVYEAVERMSAENVGSVVVVDERMRPVGIFTERDLLIKVCARGLDPKATRLSEVMTRDPIVVREDEPARKALEIMIHFGFRHVPVVDGQGRVIGVISLRDLSRAAAGEVDVEELHAAG
ncbi:MAG: CBS domain-containing protein [Desulfurococcales archaeon]|nr:CBS domain-containing protein [Desulfurococcales archaeon]